jgi:hypothetical protein
MSILALVPAQFSVNASREPSWQESLIVLLCFLFVYLALRQARRENF